MNRHQSRPEGLSGGFAAQQDQEAEESDDDLSTPRVPPPQNEWGTDRKRVIKQRKKVDVSFIFERVGPLLSRYSAIDDRWDTVSVTKQDTQLLRRSGFNRQSGSRGMQQVRISAVDAC